MMFSPEMWQCEQCGELVHRDNATTVSVAGSHGNQETLVFCPECSQ